MAKYNVGSRVVAVAARNIRKGEEVSENYFPYYPYMARWEGGFHLRSGYFCIKFHS